MTLQFSLSKFAAIDNLVVDSAPYLELTPASASVVAGRSGAGKTLLVWALYYTPLVLAERIAAGLSPEAADVIRDVADFIAYATGTRRLLRAIREGVANVKVCRVWPTGEKKCIKVSDEDCCRRLDEDTLNVMRQAALIAAIPLQLRALAYAASTMHKRLEKILRVRPAPDGSIEYGLNDVLDALEKRDESIGLITRLILAKSLPPLEIRSDIGTWCVTDAVSAYNVSQVMARVKPIHVDAVEQSVEYSWGQIGRRLLDYNITYLAASLERLGEYDKLLTPIIVLDDAFEGYAAGDAIEAARRLEKLAQRGYSVLITSHRAEIPALASNAEGLWELLVATYMIDALSRIAKVPPNYRLVLLSYRKVSELRDSYALRKIQEVILGVGEREASLAEA